MEQQTVSSLGLSTLAEQLCRTADDRSETADADLSSVEEDLERDLASRRLFRRRASCFLDLGDDDIDVGVDDDGDFSAFGDDLLDLGGKIFCPW